MSADRTSPPAAAAAPPLAAPAPAGADAPVRLMHAGRNRTKATIWQVGAPPDARVVKEISSCPAWVRLLFGRRQLAREARAYRALSGLPGIPSLIRAEAERLEIAFVDGLPLPALPRERLGERLFDRLADLLAAIHARGVACGDLHHRNVLVGPDGSVHLVDFALATVRRRGPLSGWLFRRLARLDEAAAVRMRLRYLRRPPSHSERAILDRDARLWHAARRLKGLIRGWRRARGRGARPGEPS